MRLFTRFRGYGILTVALALFSVSIVLSFDRMLKEQSEFGQTAGEAAIWAVSQAEVQLYQMRDTLRDYAPGGPVDHVQVVRRYRALVSGIDHLNQGALAVKLHQIAGADQMLDDLLTSVHGLEPSVNQLAATDRDGIARLEQELDRIRGPLHQIAVETLRRSDSLADSQRQRFNDIYFQLLVYFAGIFIGGTLLLVLLFRGIRKANRLLVERQRTEERLRESEQRFRDYAASSSDWLWETDAKGRFTYFSKGYLEKVGLGAIEILGKSHEEIAIVEPDDPDWIRYRDLTGQRLPFRDVRYRMRTDTGTRHIKVSGVPIFAHPGTFMGYRGTGSDLTAQVEAETEAMRVRSLLFEAVESVDEGFALFDVDDRMVQCNSRFRELYGDGGIAPGAAIEDITRAAARRGLFRDAIGREDAWVRERLDHRDHPELPDELQMSDGRWIQAREKILENGWRVVTRIDITHQKRREEALRREALIWEQMSDGVIVTDLRGQITNFNPAAERMFGYVEAEVLGQSPQMLNGADDPTLVSRILAGLDGNNGWTGEINFRRKDGGAGVAETVVLPLRDDRGERIAVIWVNHDITARKLVETELVAAKEQAELANQAKSQFLATMSHEIRTPMNGVLGMIGLLLDTKLDEEQRGYAETVRESGEALVAIINDILDFSKMEAGKLALEQVDFDLRQVVEGVVDLLAPRAQAKAIEIGAVIEPETPTALRGDPGRLRQILLNLAGNAVKFTERGGVSIRVYEVGSTSDRTLLRFDVVDSGIGIPEHLQEGLFSEFTQGDPSFTRRYGGTGLGLAICKKLSEMMGGDIGFTSARGRGSMFWFTVDLERQMAAAPADVAPSRLPPMRVLVVDDNDTARAILVRQLDALGAATGAAAGAVEALAALSIALRRHQPYDVALIDERLGTGTGIDLARQIRHDPTLAPTKLVLVLSLASRADPEALRQAGFDSSLAKPTRQSALRNCLSRLADTTMIARAAAAAAEQRTPSTAPHPSPRLAQARVLLVEDSPVNQMVATAMLAKHVARIDTARNGIEAIEAVREQDYDLILMDVAMPEMDGIEATRIIRTLPEPKGQLPIIAMTAHAMAGDRQRCLAAGMDDYVTKPVDRARLIQTVDHWLNLAASPLPAAAGPTGAVPIHTVAGWPHPPASTEPIQAPLPSPTHAAAWPDAKAGTVAAATAPVTGNGTRGADNVLDVETLDRLEADTGPVVVKDLVKTFILETADRLDRIAHAAQRGELGLLEREAHSLKSSSRTFGAMALHERAQAIEAACRAGDANQAARLTDNIRTLAISAANAMVRHFSPAA